MAAVQYSLMRAALAASMLATAQVPQPTEPISVPVYRIGTLTAATSGQTIWVFPSETKLDTRKSADGKSLLFTGAPGTYRVYEVAPGDGKAEPKTFERTIQITGDVPPSPNPTPGPVPPVPPGPGPHPSPSPPGPGKFNVAPLVYEMASKLPPSAKERAPAVAAAFRSLSSAIAAGTIGMTTVSGETRKAFDVATAPFTAQWTPLNNAAIERLKPQIRSVAALGEAYAEIADGLARVAAK